MAMTPLERRGVMAAVLLWAVAAVAIVVDVVAGLLLAVPILFASFGVPSAVQIYLTRRWPRVEADSFDQNEDWNYTLSNLKGGASTRYTQRLSYDYQGTRRETSLTWGTVPPRQVVLRVNPRDPAEVYCLEYAGDHWVSALLLAVLMPAVAGLMVWADSGRSLRFVLSLALFGATVYWGRRLHPVDRPDTFASRGTPSTWGSPRSERQDV